MMRLSVQSEYIVVRFLKVKVLGVGTNMGPSTQCKASLSNSAYLPDPKEGVLSPSTVVTNIARETTRTCVFTSDVPQEFFFHHSST